MLAVHWYGIISLLVNALIFIDYCDGGDGIMKTASCFGNDTLKVVKSTTGTISSDEVDATNVQDDLECYWLLNSTFTNYLVEINFTNGKDHVIFGELDHPTGCINSTWWNWLQWWRRKCSDGEEGEEPNFKGGDVKLKSGIFCYKTENCDYSKLERCIKVENTPVVIQYTLKEAFSFTYHFTDCSPKTTSQPMSSVSTNTSTAIMLNTTPQTTPDKETISSSEQVAANSSEPADTLNDKKNSSSRPIQDTFDGENTLVIASCSVGAVLLLICMVILIIVIYRKRKKQGGKGMSGGRSEPAVSDQREIVNNEIYNMDIAPNNEREMVDNVLYGSADPAQNQKVDNALYATAENI